MCLFTQCKEENVIASHHIHKTWEGYFRGSLYVMSALTLDPEGERVGGVVALEVECGAGVVAAAVPGHALPGDGAAPVVVDCIWK